MIINSSTHCTPLINFVCTIAVNHGAYNELRIRLRNTVKQDIIDN